MFTSKTLIIKLLIVLSFSNILYAHEKINSYPKELTFVYSFPESNPLTKWHISIYKEALSRLNINLIFLDVPAKRAKAYVKNGTVDGDLGRIYTFNENIKNIVRVEEHNHIVSWSAYSTNPNMNFIGWNSLKDTDIKVEYRRGVKMCENKLPKIINSNNLSEINTIEQGLNKLILGRTDLFIGVDDVINKYINEKGINKEKTIIYNVGNMQTITGHAWLNKKHSYLAVELSKVIKDMKNEGLFTKYLKEQNLNPKYLRW